MVTAALVTLAAAALAPAASGSATACRLPSDVPRQATRRAIAPADLASLRDIGAFDSSVMTLPSPLAISPDGTEVAFILTQAMPEANSHCRWLLVADIAPDAKPRVADTGGELITLRYDVRGTIAEVGYPDTISPVWSPGGKAIGYLRRDKGVTQLWRAFPGDGSASPVTASPVDIEAWAWLDDRSAVVASKPGRIAEAQAIETEGLHGWLYDARFVPNYGSRPQRRGDVPRRYDTIDLATGSIRKATAEEAARVEPERASGLPAPPNIVGADGQRAWTARETASLIGDARLHFADGLGREIRCAQPECAGTILSIWWDANQRSVVYLRREGWAQSEMAFYRWTPATAELERLHRTGDVLLGCLLRASTVLCTSEASTRPRRIVEIDPETGKTRTIYDPNPEFAALNLSTVRRLRITNDLGLKSWADLVLPPGYKAGTRLPTIVVQYHSDGFLRGGTGDEYPIFPLAARGFAVLSLERPASVAKASEASSEIGLNRALTKDWAKRRSMLSTTLKAVQQVVDLGVADPARIGITGLSDGASSAKFAMVNTNVFSAAAISTSSFEPSTIMTHGGIALADYNKELGYPPASADDKAFWKPFSIALKAKTFDIPLLIQASDDEYLLSLETFTALREHGKPVELYVFPDEHHIKWQPRHRLAVYERTIDWFAFWFQGKIDPHPGKAAQYERWAAMRARMKTTSPSPPSNATP